MYAGIQGTQLYAIPLSSCAQMVYSSGTGRTSVMGRICKLSIVLETNFITDVFSNVSVAEVISLRPSKWCFNELCIMT